MWKQAVLFCTVLTFGIFLPSAADSGGEAKEGAKAEYDGKTAEAVVDENGSENSNKVRFGVWSEYGACKEVCGELWRYRKCTKQGRRTCSGPRRKVCFQKETSSDCECGVKKCIKTRRKKRIAIKGGAKQGEDDADPNEYPWQVWIKLYYITGTSKCGGSIISKRTILTAAHCIPKNFNISNHHRISVFVGLREIGDQSAPNAKFMNVKNYTLHDNYDSATFHYDAALLFLEDDITWNEDVKPICLPKNSAALYEGVAVTATGWGNNYFNKMNGVLHEAQMKTMSNDECRRKDTELLNGFEPKIIESQICAFSQTEWTCSGDSGGPLITKVDDNNYYEYYEQIGVVSFSARAFNVTSKNPGWCVDTEESPGVFTRVTAIMDWINQHKEGDTCRRPS